ncbi:MAG: hypothetical protein GY720_01700 [bacterium]|nr:hypothetical protein [bacterium]
MGLKIKDAPRALRAELIEVVWPGDTAVDQDQSDIPKWLKDGGKSGLVFNDEAPCVIKMRKLSPDELQYVMGMYASPDPATRVLINLRAFQIACVKLGDDRVLRTEIGSGIPIMQRKQLNQLMDETIEVQIGESEDVFPRTLPDVIGEQILTLSFS